MEPTNRKKIWVKIKGGTPHHPSVMEKHLEDVYNEFKGFLPDSDILCTYEDVIDIVDVTEFNGDNNLTIGETPSNDSLRTAAKQLLKDSTMNLINPVHGYDEYPFYAHQKTILKSILNSNHRKFSILGARQIGLSTISNYLNAYSAFFAPNTVNCIIARTAAMAGHNMDKIYESLCCMAKRCGVSEDAIRRNNKYTIELENGSRIVGTASYNPNQFRGCFFNNLFIDDATMIRNFGELWECIYPTLIHTNVFATSTSLYKDANVDFAFELFTNAALEHPDFMDEWEGKYLPISKVTLLEPSYKHSADRNKGILGERRYNMEFNLAK